MIINVHDNFAKQYLKSARLLWKTKVVPNICHGATRSTQSFYNQSITEMFFTFPSSLLISVA